MKTTLNKIRAHGPCAEGWEKLLKHLRKTKSDDEPLSLLTILDSNGLDDALWCFRAIDGRDKEIRLYAVWCARQVQHLMRDPRSRAALDVAERYANGEATAEELDAATVFFVALAAGLGLPGTADGAHLTAKMLLGGDARAAAGAAARKSAARDAARVAQEARLREVCNEVQGEKQ